MPFLLDTNCWMQIVRLREHAQEVRDFLASVPADQVSISDFALHSIGLAMRRHKMLELFPKFISESGIGVSVRVLQLQPSDLKRVVDACGTLVLNFDDAYQYVTAEMFGLDLVSLDVDFDRTPRGRLTPAAALQRYTDEQSKLQP